MMYQQAYNFNRSLIGRIEELVQSFHFFKYYFTNLPDFLQLSNLNSDNFHLFLDILKNYTFSLLNTINTYNFGLSKIYVTVLNNRL